jgi:ankyrin repeat protein
MIVHATKIFLPQIILLLLAFSPTYSMDLLQKRISEAKSEHELLALVIAATRSGDTDNLKEFLEKSPGLDVNIRDKEGTTPLMRILKFPGGKYPEDVPVPGLADVIELLLEHGADPSIRDRNGVSALDIAWFIDRRLRGKREAKYAAPPSEKVERLSKIASELNDIEKVIDLLTKRLGYTPLMLAVLHGDIGRVKALLLENPKYISQTNKEGKTALDVAIELSHYLFYSFERKHFRELIDLLIGAAGGPPAPVKLFLGQEPKQAEPWEFFHVPLLSSFLESMQ